MKVVFLFGEICSGKSTYNHNDEHSVKLIVSDFVKELMQSEDREVLQNSKHLDTRIVDEIVKTIWNYMAYAEGSPECYIIDGIRQYTVLQPIERWLTEQFKNVELEYKWLEVSSAERKRRFEARKDPKDTLTFEEAEKRDNELGLSELFSILKEQNKI